MTIEKRFVGIKDLATYLGIPTNTIRSWIQKRQIPYFKVGRLIRFDITALEDWLKSRKIKELP